MEELLSKVYSGIGVEWFCERAILTHTNEMVDSIKSKFLHLTSTEERTYLPINHRVEDKDAENYPIEFVNSLTPPRMPLNKRTLKIGSPIMCLRNLKRDVLPYITEQSCMLTSRWL